MKRILVILPGFLLSCCYVFPQAISQHIINSTSNSVTVKTLHISYSVGDIAVTTLSAPNMILTQGFLQPDIRSHTSGVEELSISDKISVFPNPANDRLWIRQDEDIIQSVSVYNIYGQLLINQKYISPFLSLQSLPPGLYLVNILPKNQSPVLVFKIIRY